MYYYDIEDFEIVKYEVELNIEKLNLLKIQIVNECSEIVHKSYETVNPSSHFNQSYIKNYLAQKTEKKDENNNDIYLISYDLYNVPYLVTLIDSLLNGNTSVINEIQNYKECFSIENSEICDTYNTLLNELNSVEDIKIYGVQENMEDKSKRKDLLKQMEELLTKYQSERKVSYDAKKIEKYRERVLNCIDFKLVKRISLKKFIEVINFFEHSSKKELSGNLQKILKR